MTNGMAFHDVKIAGTILLSKGGITPLHEGDPNKLELAKLRKLFKSAQARMMEMSTKTKKGKRHLEKLKTKIR